MGGGNRSAFGNHEDIETGAPGFAAFIPEQTAQTGDVTEHRDFALVTDDVLGERTAQGDDFTEFDACGGLGFAHAETRLGRESFQRFGSGNLRNDSVGLARFVVTQELGDRGRDVDIPGVAQGRGSQVDEYASGHGIADVGDTCVVGGGAVDSLDSSDEGLDVVHADLCRLTGLGDHLGGGEEIETGSLVHAFLKGCELFLGQDGGLSRQGESIESKSISLEPIGAAGELTCDLGHQDRIVGGGLAKEPVESEVLLTALGHFHQMNRQFDLGLEFLLLQLSQSPFDFGEIHQGAAGEKHSTPWIICEGGSILRRRRRRGVGGQGMGRGETNADALKPGEGSKSEIRVTRFAGWQEAFQVSIELIGGDFESARVERLPRVDFPANHHGEGFPGQLQRYLRFRHHHDHRVENRNVPEPRDRPNSGPSDRIEPVGVMDHNVHSLTLRIEQSRVITDATNGFLQGLIGAGKCREHEVVAFIKGRIIRYATL